MKKLLLIFLALAFLWGCEKIDSDVPVKDEVIQGETPDIEETDSLVTDYVLPEILYASMLEEEQEPETRTYVDNNVVLWQNGDAISYFASNIHNARYLYTGDDGLSKVELTKDNEKVGTTGNVLLKSQAVYPYNENITVVYEDNVDKINLTYPVTQKYGVNSFGKDANIMVSVGTHNNDDNLYFRNACGYLVIKLYGAGTTIKSITLSSISGVDKIAGPAVVVASNDAAPVVTMADEASVAVTLDCSNGGQGVALGADKANATEFWFCLPPVSFTEGIKIIVNDVNDNTFIKQTSNNINIVRNEVQPMSALKFESNAPTVAKLWYTRSDDLTTPVAFYDDKTNPFDATIKGHYYDETEGKFVIEFTSPLTTIKEFAFRDTQIETITLPEGLVTIEKEAFRNTSLTEITIPGSVNNVGIDVFWDCSKLSEVTFLPSATKTPLNIGYLYGAYRYGPFYDAPLTSIDINRELILVKDDGSDFIQSEWWHGMFANKYWDAVESVSVKIGPQVETLSNYMFNYLPIQALTIPGTVKTIGNCVFDECTSLTSLTYEPSPTGEALTHGYNDDSNDDGPFYASPLTSVNLDREINYTYASSAANAEEGLFGNKTSLASVTLGEQVKTLSKFMFANAVIEELVIPGSVTTIQNDVFRGCTNLATLTFNPSPSGTALTMGYDTEGETENLFQDNDKLATLNLNREINYTFAENDIDSDSEGVFGGMPTLTSVTLGDQVKTLHKFMFAGSGITSLNLNKVETIKDYALADLGFTELTIPGTLTTIQNDVFSGCKELATLTFDPSPSGTALTMGYDTEGETENLFQDNDKLATLNLNREIIYTLGENEIDTNSEGVFGGMPTLTSVTLGDQVKTLHKFMFAGSGITELTIPGTLTTIQNDVFRGCTNLATLTFNPSPSGTALTMGYDTDGEIENLFQDNNKLATLNLNREINYTLDESAIDTNSEGVFGGMPTLTSVTLGDQVKYLHKYMFAGSGITSLNLNKVETIKDHALAGSSITELTIPGTLITIGNNVFDGCTQLTNLTFNPSSTNEPLTLGYNVSSLDEGPFYNTSLTTLTLNRQINYPFTGYSIGYSYEGAFAVKSGSLKEITLGDQVTNLTAYMFGGAGISSINLNKVRTIEQGAFCNTSIESITIPSTVESVGLNAFWGCEKLTTVNIQDGTDPLSFGAQFYQNIYGPFYDSPLTNIHLGREIKYTGYASPILSPTSWDAGFFATEEPVENVKVTISDNVKTISNYMFAKLNLHSITIPASVTFIGRNAFIDCDKLDTIVFEDGDTPLKVKYQYASSAYWGPFYDSPLTSITLGREIEYIKDDGTKYTPGETNDGFFASEESVEKLSVTFTDKVKTISEYMFAGRPIQQLTIPASVTSIGNNAFYDCDDLVSLTISFPNLAKDIFNDCDNLTSVTVSGNLNAIDKTMFAGCSKLSTLNISGSVATIGDGAFDGFNLTSLNISGHVGTIGANAFDDNDKMTSFTVTSTGSIGTIGKSAFEDSDNLQTVDIQGSVDRVCSYAFSDCDAITTLSIRANTVEDYAYEDMDGLKTATLYGATVGKGVFYDCNALQTVVIDGGVNSIGNNAFDQCTSLSSVTFESGSQDLHIGFQDESSDKGTFFDSPLTYISLDRELVYDYDDLDYWDEGIFATENYEDDDPVVTVTLGTNVKTILPWMFSCVRMKKVEIPTSVTYIGDEAFSYCYILTEVSCRNTTPPTLGEDVFYNDKDKYNNNLLIKVPYVSGNKYREKWSQYQHCVWGTYEN